MNIVEQAKLFAIKAHFNQVRKSEKDKPMIIHPIDVGNILKQYNFDDNVISAGILHDVIEDTKYTKEDILNLFGEDILSLVLGDTEIDKSLSWEERKKYTIDTVKNLDLRHKAICCADKISNLEDMMILFEKNSKYDFSSFKRGFEEQKWYFTHLYESLIYNEDSNHPMFIRLKELIDYIFNNKKNDYYVKNVIYKDSKEEYSEVLKLHFKKLEIKKLKNIFDNRPYVIEFTGTPRTGKTTLINNLKDFFKKANFEVGVLEEFTTSLKYKTKIYPKLKNEYKNIINQEIPKYVLKQLNSFIKGNKDIIIIDRSLFDRLIWADRLYVKDGFTLEEYENYKNKYIPIIKKKINVIVALFTDSITCLKRDYYANLSLEKRNFLNQENVDEYNTSLLNMKELSKKESINLMLFDTTQKSQRQISIEIVNAILDDMRKYYINYIKRKIEKYNNN